MRYVNVQIVIEKEPEDDGYYAHSPSLPGCFSNGRTVDETRSNMRDAIEAHLEAMVERGEALPAAMPEVVIEDITVAIPA